MKAKSKRFSRVDLTPEKGAAQPRPCGTLLQWALGVLVILCLVSAAWYPAEAARRRDAETRAAVGSPGEIFAIADFDGDSLPDFATVQPGPATALRTSYWIPFAFSQGGQRSFVVSGPTGGLQIASRDVNGDNFIDLIISTRLANEPVAVLLNDGRGNFRLVDAERFSQAIWEAREEWRSATLRCGGTEGALPSAGWAGGICLGERRADLQPVSAGVSIPSEKPDYFVLPHEDRGRAPPTA
jgi:hypothetical protein